MMQRKRPETTFYLGEELDRRLREYRLRLPAPPSTSSIVREAVRRFLDTAEAPRRLPPKDWIRSTEPLSRQFKELGVSIATEAILEALHDEEDERVRDLLGAQD